jgi:YhcH/YjgK/YiaL family protein
MILDHLENWMQYAALNPLFRSAFKFLTRPESAELMPGRHPIEDDRVFALVIKEEGRSREGTRLEIHRKYIDVQFTVQGEEWIGWKATLLCVEVEQAYNPEKDVAFFADSPDIWFNTPSRYIRGVLS